MSNSNCQAVRPRVLIVDDDLISREMLRFALEDEFEVEEADSGESALLSVAHIPPQLVLLDIEMPGIGGYETCRRLRESDSFPIIFVSSHDTLEERVEAFDCGANDFIVKPFDAEILARKVSLAIDACIERERLAGETQRLQKTAMGFLSNMNDSGVLMEFMRSSISCSDQYQLAKNLLEATVQYGINCHVQIRHPGGVITLTPHGAATPLEESVLEKSKEMGRVFQFRRRMVINYSMVSVIVVDTPEEVDIAGRIRDNLCILAETAEAITETISMRKDSAEKAEQLQSASLNATMSIEEVRELYRAQLNESRRLLGKLIDEVEESFIFLALTDRQEKMVTEIMQRNVAPVLKLFEDTVEMEQKFGEIIDSLQSQKQEGVPDVWLF
ncbi:response regulator [Gallionella capsiferriformans]|uniref:Response regulator receiver protein n=1 Tax=Gallionella capsiferriformans (strain ES-2) TaxID=395494 RepID=D9SDP2_GALCS|nr:response regulator [Gallionella capsiferriformans]ADL54799.1 response regulator receiver protein [Gallionella capsiferriformans ES-2]